MEELVKETQGGPTIPSGLNQNIDHYSVLIHSSPQIVLHPVHLQEHFIQVPLGSDPSSVLPKPGRVKAAELVAPVPDRFIGDLDTSLRHHLLDIPVAQGKAEVQPDALLYHFDRKPMTSVSLLRRTHRVSISYF